MKTNDSYLSFALRLAAIVTCIGFLLAGVYALTHSRIEAVTQEKSESFRRELFAGDGITFVPWDGTLTDGEKKFIDSVYLVYDANEMFLGYCMDMTTNGFKGEISMITGISANNALVGIKILSHSETLGIGTKALDESGWLAGLRDRTASNIEDVDTLSNATKTSKPLRNAAAAALQLAERINYGGL